MISNISSWKFSDAYRPNKDVDLRPKSLSDPLDQMSSINYQYLFGCAIKKFIRNIHKESPPVKYHLCGICTSNKNKALKTIIFHFSAIFWNWLCSKFWNHFQAKIIPWNPMFWDFLKVFHIIWKNQESCRSWLVEFWVSRHSEMSNISVNIYFCAFLSCHYGFTNYFEILNSVFFNIIPRGVARCKILTFQD